VFFAPFISWDASSLKSDKEHLYLDDFIPGFKTAYQRENLYESRE
jgi:hypothetical protein